MSPDPVPVTPHAPSRVMLVDDAVDDLALLGDMLKPSGIDVVTASSAEEALRLLAQQTVDLVVTDLTLPGANGLDLT